MLLSEAFMKKWLIALVAFLGLAAPAHAQSFGVKLIGIEYNTFDPGQGTGLQFTLGTLFFSTDLEVNYILGRMPLGSDPKLTLFYGAGAHVGFFGLFTFSTLGFGAHGVVGIDYLLQPNLALGVAFHPGLSFYTNNIGLGFYAGGGVHLQFKI
jgi:hypothetical protein